MSVTNVAQRYQHVARTFWRRVAEHPRALVAALVVFGAIVAITPPPARGAEAPRITAYDARPRTIALRQQLSITLDATRKDDRRGES
jgi:hypothetical protein